MACRLPSASTSRWRNSSISMVSTFISTLEGQAKSMAQAIRVGHVPDDAAEGCRPILDQRGGRDHLFSLDHLRLLVDVDDLELEAALETGLADVAHRADRSRGTWSHAGDEQPQHVVRIVGIVHIAVVFHAHAPVLRARRSSPTSTRSVLERSPMIFLMGVGSRRTSVGSARIWSPRPSAGLSTRSITSML